MKQCGDNQIDEIRYYFSQQFDGNKVIPLIDELIKLRKEIADIDGLGERCIECESPRFMIGPMCYNHGCHLCGAIILDDTQEWSIHLCQRHYEILQTYFKPTEVI